jgi:hypothetical protein
MTLHSSACSNRCAKYFRSVHIRAWLCVQLYSPRNNDQNITPLADADGFRVVVLFLSNHTLLLHRSRGEGAQGHASESSGQFACRLLGWYSDAARVPQCLSLSANGKTLGVLTADGSVYVVPVHSLLARPVSRLYHAPVTPAG